ncbi:MAG TPA: hypothetical protein VD736_07650 [Nitrososphaera sp.]|nr:hypothetical protein [Nitrososphaera sp.]
MTKTFALLLAAIISSAIYVVPAQLAFAHEFTGDESASFLALVESLRVELALVQSNLASDVELAAEHAEHAHEHLDEDVLEEIAERNEILASDLPAALEDLRDSVGSSSAQEIQTKIEEIDGLLGETISVHINDELMGNSTVWALVLVYMADGVLEHYSAAYGNATDEGQGHGHDEESNDEMNMTETSSTEGSMTNGMEMDENMTMDEGNGTIVSMVHYQSAQGMVVRMQELFADQVKKLAPADSEEAVTEFEGSLIHLKQAIDDKESFPHVEVIVHSEVHPGLQRAFNLQVIPEFPLPMLLIIPAIGVIIAATRISTLRRK